MEPINLHLGKLQLHSLEVPNVIEGILSRRYTPPSLVPEENKEPDAPPPPPTFSEAEIKAAEQDGFRRGFLEGTKEGQMQAQSEQATVNEQLTGTVAQLASELHVLLADYTQVIAEQKAEMPKLALAVARKVAAKALSENAAALVEATVMECVERILGEPQIVVTVAAPLAASLEHRLIAHFAGNQDPGEITIQGSPDMGLSDCRIEWAGGRAERNSAALWQDIEAIIDDMVAGGRPAKPIKEAPAADAIVETPPIEPTPDSNPEGE